MTKTDITKTVVKFAVGGATSFTVSNVILNNVNPKNKLQVAEALAGSFVLGYMVADYTEQYAARKVDETVEWWNSTFKKNA